MVAAAACSRTQLHLELKNPGPDYLSAGERPLPTLLSVFTALFFTCSVVWLVHLRRHSDKVGVNQRSRMPTSVTHAAMYRVR
jgi:hypothetical protein